MKILLIENHSIVRYGLTLIFTSILEYLSIDECDDFNEALKRISKEKYDLVIMEINIPNGNNLQSIRLLRLKYPEIKILVFSGSDERVFALPYLREGADGYLMKESSNQEIIEAVRCVLNNEKYLSPNMQRQLLQNLHKEKSHDNPVKNLSDRETDIMQLLIHGHKHRTNCKSDEFACFYGQHLQSPGI